MCSNRQVFDPNPELTSSYTKPMHSCKVPTTRQDWTGGYMLTARLAVPAAQH
mgnify:CR=1 FL=1